MNSIGNGYEDSLAPRGMPGQTTDRRANDGDLATAGGPIRLLAREPRRTPTKEVTPPPELEGQTSNLGIRPSRPDPRTASESSGAQCAHPTQSNLYTHRTIPGPPTGAQCAPEQQNAAQPTGSPSPPRRRNDQCPPHPASARRKAKPKPRRRKTLKAAVTVASLNIRGFGSNNVYHPNNKWLHVNQLMRDKKIGVLAVQEAHMDEFRRQKIEELFQQRLRIFASGDLENPTGKGGVAITLNREIVDAAAATETVVIEGRAISVSIPLKQGAQLTILGVYAPNDPIQNEYLWEDIYEFYNNPLNRRVPRPDIMLGDFNIIEQAIDRMPQHDDRRETVESLERLNASLHLNDGWRQLNPAEKMYTYHQKATGSQSRIDRIYAVERLCKQAREWQTRPTGIPGTDHMMVSVSATLEGAPNQGPGRRTIPLYVLKDQRIKEYTAKRMREALRDLDTLRGWRSAQDNPQRILHSFKMDIRKAAIKRQKRMVPVLVCDLRATEAALKEVHTNGNTTEKEKIRQASVLTERMRALERKRHEQTRKDVKLKNRLEGETISKSWCRLGKEKAPRDVIYALRKPASERENEERYEKDSKRMAHLAREYHESLQQQGIEENELKRILCEMTVLRNITMSTTEDQREDLAAPISKSDVTLALKKSKKDSAAGLDGLTYEFWAEMQRQSKALEATDEEDSNADTEDELPDILDLLTEAFRDIQEFGVDDTTAFAEGWMCPIFKKKDRSDIANYRPITLLNTDYKLYTKCLTLKLATAAPDLINKAQAGFIPERQIHDHTQLTHLIMELAATADPEEDENGMIIALDQEKAYDKITHRYLWMTLRKFNIPESFICSVKTLYENAETCVMVNGCLSKPFKITRGVRQGDPLSCLLFDLAIEPLAASLRASTLKGYDIHQEKPPRTI